MTEYITKEQAYLCMLEHWEGDMLPGDYDDYLREIPPADVAPVVHAHWITAEDDDFWTCSNCRKYIPKDCAHGYCPKCGAKMSGEKNG